MSTQSLSSVVWTKAARLFCGAESTDRSSAFNLYRSNASTTIATTDKNVSTKVTCWIAVTGVLPNIVWLFQRTGERLVCVGADAMRAIIQRERPTATLLGMALALFSIVIMPLLAAAKRKVGSALASDALKADATQSALCGYFALILLAGLFADQRFGFWWADSAASLVMVPLIAAEAKRALEGRKCSHCR